MGGRIVRSCNANWSFFLLGLRLRFPPPPPPPPASALTWTVILVLPAPPPAAAADGERRDGCRGESWFVVVLALLLAWPMSTWQRRPSREQEKKRPGDGEVAQVTQSLNGGKSKQLGTATAAVTEGVATMVVAAETATTVVA